MALTFQELFDQTNTGVVDAVILERLQRAATAYVERQLGFKIDDAQEFPDGTPADLELAILQLVAHWYENREATVVGVTAQAIPFGVREIVDGYRTYTFRAPDDGE